MTKKSQGSCPRCRSSATDLLAKSATKGIWSMFGCSTCKYTWRSTEGPENTDSEHYPKIFRIDPDHITTLPVVPVIPALTKTKH